MSCQLMFGDVAEVTISSKYMERVYLLHFAPHDIRHEQSIPNGYQSPDR